MDLTILVFALKLWRNYLYEVHVDVFTDQKSLQYVFTQRELNQRQRRWFELLRYYDMNVPYHQGKANGVADGLRRMSMGNIAHVDNGKNELVNDVHRLDRLSVRLVEFTSWGALVHPSSESSLVVEVKEGQHLDNMFMELKDQCWLR